MNERGRFVALAAEGLFTVSELCARFGISRKSGYQWLARYREGGLTALADAPRAPHSCPHHTSLSVEKVLLQAREAPPHWGPKKLLPYVQKRHPELVLPAPSTVGALLKRHGLIPSRRPRRRAPADAAPPLVTEAPNQVWCADFKGKFRTRDGRWCYPLTVTDAHSRVLLACQALPATAIEGAVAVFTRLFVEYGLPQAIRTDNGAPFASVAVGGLSQLSLTWLKLGIVHQRITPGRPQENGQHERVHRTLKAETTRPPEGDLAGQQARFDRFRQEYNEERPHEALGQEVPAAHYVPSERLCPQRLSLPVYPGHWLVRRVGASGCFRFHGSQVFLSEVVIGETIGLEEVEEELWSVHLYARELARYDAGTGRLHG